MAGFSLLVGVREISPGTVLSSFMEYDPQDPSELVVQTLRLPRLLASVLCGVSFAAAGALMQGITHNPLASPSILGINAGAGFGLTIGMILLPLATLNQTILFAVVGAAIATMIVLLLAGRMGAAAGPIYLALAGTAINAMFVAVTQLLVVTFAVAQDLSYWTAGGISGIRMEQVLLVLPWTMIGLIAAIALARSITLLNFGDEMAVGFGIRVHRVQILTGIIVLILSGSAVALSGPVGFVGLITPHIARKLVGIDYREVIPVTALLGAILVLGADMAARIIHPPFETPLGAITALLGVPFFLYLATRTERLSDEN